MKQNKYSKLYTILFLGLCACNKPELKQPEEQKLQIQIQKPTENSSYYFQDTVWIKIIISDPVELHQYEVSIFDFNSKKLIQQIDLGHTHSNIYLLDTFWVANISSTEKLYVNIFASNHNENKLESRVNFLLNQ